MLAAPPASKPGAHDRRLGVPPCVPPDGRRALLAHFGERRGGCAAAAGEELCDVCADAAGVRAALAALNKKLQAAAIPEQDAAEAADPFDRGDEGPGCSAIDAAPPKPAPLQMANAAAARRPLAKPAIPARRSPLPPAALQAPAVVEEKEEGGADAVPEGVVLPPGGSLHAVHAAAAAGMKRPRAGFQPPRRVTAAPQK
jgi:hypothetical protein